METKVTVKKFSAGKLTDADDFIAIEEPLEISLQWNKTGKIEEKKIAITMRTPGADRELAVGFLFNEGVILSPSQIERIGQSSDGTQILITLVDGTEPELRQVDRNFFTTSSCGVCGKQELGQLNIPSAFSNATNNNTTVSSDILINLEKQVAAKQEIFSTTGGLHAAALFSEDGRLMSLMEDVGRHNALDKLIGSMFLEKLLPLPNTILFLSGRASFELLQKASMAGINIVAAVGAPSTLAISHAEKSGITLIGFLRNEKFNIYTHADRVHVSSKLNYLVHAS